MVMIDVESTQLAKIGWGKETLHVVFVGGNAEFRYTDVPEHLFEEMKASESIGRFFNSKIKGRFVHTKHEFEK